MKGCKRKNKADANAEAGKDTQIRQDPDQAVATPGLAVAPSHSETEFEAMFLRQATREFADDLEKLRSADDFKSDKSVPILIEALKQGTHCYSTAEKQRMLQDQATK